jgi:hypothetical protein
MRWDGLFADLEAQASALSIAERGAEIEDRTRYETGQLALIDRLRPATGTELRLRCLGGVVVRGLLRRAHPEWLLLDEAAGREALVPVAAVCSFAGLGRTATPAAASSVLDARLGLRHALRLLARDRSNLRVHLVDAAVLDGTLDRVGADFAEIAVHAVGESRRRAAVTEVLSVPFRAMVALRRDG